MKTSLAKAIALAATLGAAASAQAAMSINHDGLGEVLLYPLYTVENGNDTAISVTNTTEHTKVVKVRFREALNSQDVLDFHLFLSPKDVWNGVVVATEDGAKLITRDSSCTVPAIPAEGANFTNLAYTGGAVETATRGQDNGPQDLKRTRVGYVEVIEMGVINPTAKFSVAGYTDQEIAAAVEHDGKFPAKPVDCSGLTAEYTKGKWQEGAGFDLTHGFDIDATKLGGLYGVGTITNVFAGQQIGYDATAIAGFIDPTTPVPNLHNETGYSYPDLNGNRQSDGTLIPGAAVQANIGGNDYTFAKTIDAVSALLQKTSINNDYAVEAAVGAGTDWVVTFPTKHFYVWDSQIDSAATADAWSLDPAQTLVSPFHKDALWGPKPDADKPELAGTAKAPVQIGLKYFDREENYVDVPRGIDFSPRPVVKDPKFYLDYEANVITFNNSNVLVAEDTYARYNWNLDSKFQSGWATINLLESGTGVNVVKAGGDEFYGLPAIGFATIKVNNGDIGGVRSAYNAAWNHKATTQKN